MQYREDREIGAWILDFTFGKHRYNTILSESDEALSDEENILSFTYKGNTVKGPFSYFLGAGVVNVELEGRLKGTCTIEDRIAGDKSDPLSDEDIGKIISKIENQKDIFRFIARYFITERMKALMLEDD